MIITIINMVTMIITIINMITMIITITNMINWSFSDAGAIIFENETLLEFSRQFLSISISTNKAVYDGGQDIR